MSSFKIVNLIKQKNADMYGERPVTIAFLGDSVTHGCFEVYKTGEASIETIFDNENSYSMKLKKLIAMYFPRVQVNIIDSGISGDNAPNGFSRLERDILPFHPDLVVVCYGLNDCGNGLNGLSNYTGALKNIFQKLKEKDIDAIFMTPNMMNTYVDHEITDPFLLEIAKNLSKIQNEQILKQYVNAAITVAEEEGIPVCDCYSKWETMYENGSDITKLLSNRLNHPTRDMHWLFANSLFDMIFIK
jgi:lysophospholipase L1-like esterase